MSRPLFAALLAAALLGGGAFAYASSPLVDTTVDLAERPVTPSAPAVQAATGDGAATAPTSTPDPDVRPEPDWAAVVAQAAAADAEQEQAAAEEEDEEDYDVAGVQSTLADLHYYGGPVDGEEGPRTIAAVMAFQKVQGLSADGVVGPNTLAALAAPETPSLAGGEANRIEVDLTKQVLYFVENGALTRIMPVSSGSGESYETSDGGTARSLTPVGTYRIERRIRGVREADLGTLYDPLYFYRGWAIHGSNSVPAYPASHGCIRVTRSDALWLFDRAPNGTQVSIYGGTHTFGAGSSAAGTSTPGGDTPDTTPVTPVTTESEESPPSSPPSAAPEETAPPPPAPSTPPPSAAPASEEPPSAAPSAPPATAAPSAEATVPPDAG